MNNKIATQYSNWAAEWTVQGSDPDGGNIFFTSPKCPDWL
jgi:hypothetical protein